MRVTVSGATGLVGSALVEALRARGDEVTVLSRSGASGGQHPRSPDEARSYRWEPVREPAPRAALAGRDAIVHLAGESIAQRWSTAARRAIRDSRVLGTRNLVDALRALSQDCPRMLLSASAIGYYGEHGDQPLDEESPAGSGFLAAVCAGWEQEAARAVDLGARVVHLRTGVVLDPTAGALAKMLPPFRLGLGGPVAGGRQYVSWVHRADLVGIALAAIDDVRWSGAVNATAPAPVRNAELAQILGRTLHRPALMPVPGPLLRLRYGEMASLITGGARVMPAKALVLGYRFRHPDLGQALSSVLT